MIRILPNTGRGTQPGRLSGKPSPLALRPLTPGMSDCEGKEAHYARRASEARIRVRGEDMI